MSFTDNSANPHSRIEQPAQWLAWHDKHVRCDGRFGTGRCYGMRLPGTNMCAAHQGEAGATKIRLRKPSTEDVAPVVVTSTMKKTRKPSED